MEGSSSSLEHIMYLGLQDAKNSSQIINAMLSVHMRLTVTRENCGLKSSLNKCWKMVKDDLLYHVQFFIFQESSWVLSKVQQCMCVCALGLGYKWFLNESSAKYQLCEAPAVQFFIFIFWDIGTETDSILRLLLVLWFCTVQLVSIGTVTHFSVVLALYSRKLTWNETMTENKVLTISFKGVWEWLLSYCCGSHSPYGA